MQPLPIKLAQKLQQLCGLSSYPSLSYSLKPWAHAVYQRQDTCSPSFTCLPNSPFRVSIFCQSCLNRTTNSKVESLEVFGRQTPDTGVSTGNGVFCLYMSHHTNAGNYFRVLTFIFRHQQPPSLQYKFSAPSHSPSSLAFKWKRRVEEGSSSDNTITI